MPDLTQEGLAAREVPELLPCPLCGVEPEYSPPSEVSDLPFIACPTVVMTPEGFDEKCGLTSQSVAHWNKRAALIREAEARGMERAAAIADHFADQDYAAMGYPEDGGIAASGTAYMIQQEIRAEAAALRKDEEPK